MHRTTHVAVIENGVAIPYEGLFYVVVIVDGGVVGETMIAGRRAVSAGAAVERHTGNTDERDRATASVSQSTVSAVGDQSVDRRIARRLEPVFAQPAVQLHSRDPQLS